MNVYEQRKAIVRRMKRELGSDYVVVSGPDHPLLLRSPDVIIGGRGHLLAIMCATVREVRQPSLARARLTLARAALPSETAFAFVAVSSSEQLAEQLAGDLDAIITHKKLDDLPRVDRSQASLNLVPEREKARMLAMRRFGHAYRLAQLINLDGDKKQEKNLKRGSRKPPSYQGLESGIEKAEFFYDPSPSDLADLSLNGAGRAFSLDEGVSYPVGYSGVAYIEDIPAGRGDPGRYIRANAFAGWILAPAPLENQHTRLAEIILRVETRS